MIRTQFVSSQWKPTVIAQFVTHTHIHTEKRNSGTVTTTANRDMSLLAVVAIWHIINSILDYRCFAFLCPHSRLISRRQRTSACACPYTLTNTHTLRTLAYIFYIYRTFRSRSFYGWLFHLTGLYSFDFHSQWQLLQLNLNAIYWLLQSITFFLYSSIEYARSICAGI